MRPESLDKDFSDLFGRQVIFSVYSFLPVTSCLAQRRLELICVGAFSFEEVKILYVHPYI